MYLKDVFFSYFIFLFVLLCYNMGVVQDNLSFEEVIVIGLSNNFQVQFLCVFVVIVENNNDWLLVGCYLQVNLIFDVNNSYFVIDNFVSVVVESLVLSNVVVLGIQVNWVLYNGLQVSYVKDQLNK